MNYTVFESERDAAAVARLLSHAFAGTPDQAAQWIGTGEPGQMRVMRAEDGSTPACLMRIPMAQYFGGQSVPMTGIAGVAVGPEDRGKGLALAMMKEAVREMHREGTAVSCLYCSTQALYRQVGYEQAGMRFCARVPIGRIGVKEKARSVRALTEADDGAIRACYAAWASRFNGMVDRGTYIWNRVRKMRDVPHTPFGFFDAAGRLTAYLFMAQVRDPASGRHDITLSDVAFTTPGAGLQCLAFLADFEPMANEVTFYGSPLHPLLTLLPQQRYRIELKDFWLLRITNIRAALSARGYPPGADAKVTLDVTDEAVPEQAGAWTLRVARGRGAVERGGGGAVVRCSVGGLASLYSGLYTPAQAALLGLCEGSVEALAAAEGAFPGATPWMSDFF